MSGSFAVRKAVRIVKQGGIIAYPTEAVFGLGCDPGNTTAIKRLLRLKQRPIDKGLILVAAEFAQLNPWLSPLPESLQSEIMASWPGPVTWLLPTPCTTSRWLRGQHQTLAVRVSAHQVVQQLCRCFGGTLVSTSANRSGRRPARSRLAVRRQFGRQLDYIVPGEVGGAARPSTIRDAGSGRVIRA